MPATVANLFASTTNTASAAQTPKLKSSSSSSTDFGDQLKDAQQTQAQAQTQTSPKPKQETKVVRRDATKSTRSTKSRGKATTQTDDQPAAPASQKKTHPDAAVPDQQPPEASDQSDDSSSDSDKDAPKQSAENGGVNPDGSAQSTTPVMTPPIMIAGQPIQVPQKTIEDRSKLLSSPVRETPYQTGVTAKAAPQTPSVPQGTTTASQPAQATKKSTDISVSNLDTPDAQPGGDLDAPAAVATKSAAKTAAAQAVAAAVDPVATFAGDAAPTPALPVDSNKISADDALDVAAILPASSHPATVHAIAPQPAASTDALPQHEAQFAQANHANIVSDVKTALLPRGGTMQIRLDPPELGALQVNVEVRNGAVNATFQTSNDDATRLLSHSLGQLKTALESQGVTVDKIQVQQSPKNQNARNDTSQQQQPRDDTQARQNQRDQQRREMLQKMWAKVSGQQMPVDLVA